MVTKTFLLGASGYIGGDALFALIQAHPEYEIACLVRNSDKGTLVASQHSKVRLVYGGLDNVDLLEQEARKADIVLNCTPDRVDTAEALCKGLAARKGDRPGFLIHTSGNAILFFPDTDRKTFGEASTKVYDDWDGIGEVTSVPDHALHRKTDKVVIDADGPRAKTAIVCPPTIYGKGRGPSNQISMQVPDMAKITLERKKGFQVGAGENRMPYVHIHDLSECYLKLVEAAAAGGGKATWGKEGYYFVESGEQSWGSISKAIATAAHKQGFLPSNEVFTITDKEADKMIHFGSAMWGANSRNRAIRARKLLGWSPKEKALDAYIAEAVDTEAKNLGLVQGHASKVAG